MWGGIYLTTETTLNEFNSASIQGLYLNHVPFSLQIPYFSSLTHLFIFCNCCNFSFHHNIIFTLLLLDVSFRSQDRFLAQTQNHALVCDVWMCSFTSCYEPQQQHYIWFYFHFVKCFLPLILAVQVLLFINHMSNSVLCINFFVNFIKHMILVNNSCFLIYKFVFFPFYSSSLYSFLSGIRP